ncbi:MAG TPA: hypothetical protein DCG28_03675 [Lachnospiraceae bacterium]|nr:hypothetical protein [Lachnospiraceae bacterium]
MQILIDINDDIYARLFDNGETNMIDMQEVCVAVRKGVVIPKTILSDLRIWVWLLELIERQQ